MLKILYYSLGLSTWFPAFSVIDIGNSTGLQLPLLIAGLIFFIRMITFKGLLLINRNALIFTVLNLFSLVISAVISSDLDKALKELLGIISCFFVLIMLAERQTKREYELKIVDGFLTGGIISVSYVIYQAAGFYYGLPFLSLLNNNPSFPTYAASANLDSLGRAFGFTPEPSVLATILIPAIFFTLNLPIKSTRKILLSGTYLLGLLLSTSLSSLIAVPITAILSCLFYPKRIISIRGLLPYVGIIACIIILIFVIPQINVLATSAWDSMTYRINRFDEDWSLLVRYNAMLVSWDIFCDNPLWGYGITTSDEYLTRMPSEILAMEGKNGVDSWGLRILAQQGLVGFVSFLGLYMAALKNTYSKPAYFTALLALFVVINVQTAYWLLYHVWVLLGIGFSTRDKEMRMKT